MKLISFGVPCYNSAAYMSHCVETLLTGGEEVEIILVNDGSSDETGAIADRYAAQYPDIIRVIHQENGGHGEGVNQGLRHATGLYYKVVDSDDWVDEGALREVLDRLRRFVEEGRMLDLFICNFVYEHVEDNTQHTMRYTNVFPVEKVFTWEEIGTFTPSQYLLMHSVIYRTELLRDCGLELPKHTFYVDNIFVYQPLPAVKSIYYMDLDLYRYFIGRLDSQGAEKLVGRGDMLYAPLGSGKPLRVQGCFISDEEREEVIRFVKESGGADYSDEIMHEIERNAEQREKGSASSSSGDPSGAPDSDADELLPAAVDAVMETGQASVSMLQRRLKLGYSRAARLVDQMEERGIVGPFEGSKPRHLLITKEQWQEMKLRNSFVIPAPEASLPSDAPAPDDQAQ